MSASSACRRTYEWVKADEGRFPCCCCCCCICICATHPPSCPHRGTLGATNPSHAHLPRSWLSDDDGSRIGSYYRYPCTGTYLLRTVSASLAGTGWLLGSSFLPVQIRVCFIDAFMNHPQTIGPHRCMHTQATHWPGFVHSAKVS